MGSAVLAAAVALPREDDPNFPQGTKRYQKNIKKYIPYSLQARVVLICFVAKSGGGVGYILGLQFFPQRLL